MKGFDRGRRLALAALAAFAWVLALPSLAQDPRFTEAQAAARDWLALADANDAAGTHAASAQKFKTAMTAEQWSAAMARAREQFGDVVRRTILRTETPPPGPDVPPGDFVVIQWRTEFAKRPQGIETMTLEREADGKWRVVGYLMR
jgi:hypothetical protein